MLNSIDVQKFDCIGSSHFADRSGLVVRGLIGDAMRESEIEVHAADHQHRKKLK